MCDPVVAGAALIAAGSYAQAKAKNDAYSAASAQQAQAMRHLQKYQGLANQALDKHLQSLQGRANALAQARQQMLATMQQAMNAPALGGTPQAMDSAAARSYRQRLQADEAARLATLANALAANAAWRHAHTGEAIDRARLASQLATYSNLARGQLGADKLAINAAAMPDQGWSLLGSAAKAAGAGMMGM